MPHEFVTNKSLVLMAITNAADENGKATITLREIADDVGITERAAQRIVSDLSDNKLISRSRDKESRRRSQYGVKTRVRTAIEDLESALSDVEALA